MSPEQANGATLDVRSDIFSFGAVLYELISGRRPFLGESAAQVLSAVLRDEPAPLDAPSGIARVVSRLLRKQPEHRLQTMADVRRALEEATAPGPAKQRDPRPSIAVLPFANLSGDAEQEYFADGVSEDIITELSRFRSLFVIARNSSFTYRGRAVDVRRVAEELGVRWVLEGSVRKSGNRMRVTAQLIDASDGHHVWAERYDRELSDLLEVQDDITQRIVGEIAPGIMLEEAQRAQRMDHAQLNAWDNMLRARWHAMRFTRDGWSEAIRLLEISIVQDPSASALSDLAFLLHFGAVFGWSASPRDDLARMADLARRAITVDDKDDTAQAIRGVSELFSGRHDEAVRRLQRALQLNPNSSLARGYLGVAHAFGGDHDAAIRHSEEAIRLSPRDPLLVIWHLASGWAHLSAEDYDQAIEAARQAIDDNPEFVDAYMVLAAAFGLAHRLPDARTALEGLLSRMPGLTLTDERLQRPFKNGVDQQRVIAGLRLAGLNES
jgi:TolB-like protein/cytochrome c-type biogenesis protein CcmH/NrfG